MGLATNIILLMGGSNPFIMHLFWMSWLLLVFHGDLFFPERDARPLVLVGVLPQTYSLPYFDRGISLY